MRRILIAVLAAGLAATGAASAAGTGGGHGGGSGTHLPPALPDCVCYHYGANYGLSVDEQGRFGSHQDANLGAGHFTPPTDGPEVGFDATAWRGLDASGSAAEGRAEVHSSGDGWVNTPGPSEGGVANQGLGGGDARAALDREKGARAEVHPRAWGSAVQASADGCAAVAPGGFPQGSGAAVHATLQGFPVSGGAGTCGFPKPPGP